MVSLIFRLIFLSLKSCVGILSFFDFLIRRRLERFLIKSGSCREVN